MNKLVYLIVVAGVLVGLYFLVLKPYVIDKYTYKYLPRNAGAFSHSQCIMCNKMAPEQLKHLNQDKRCSPTYLTGTLIDSRCYSLDARNYTNNHYPKPSAPNPSVAECGTHCANAGVPVGLLPMGGVPGESPVYILLTPSKDLAPYMGMMAEVKGQFMTDSKAVFTLGIRVKNAEGKWIEVQNTSPMDKLWKDELPQVSSRCCGST
jgi:hypothetical protein